MHDWALREADAWAGRLVRVNDALGEAERGWVCCLRERLIRIQGTRWKRISCRWI